MKKFRVNITNYQYGELSCFIEAENEEAAKQKVRDFIFYTKDDGINEIQIIELDGLYEIRKIF